MTRANPRMPFLAGALLAISASSLAGCTAELAETTASSAQATTPPSSAAPTGSVGDLVGMVGMRADAPVFRSSDELAGGSQIGAIGEVAGFSHGVLFTEGDLFEVEPVIVRLEDVELLSGALPSGFDGSLYVALPGYASPEEYASAIVTGTRMAVYGNDLAGEGATVRAGAPADQAIINIAHPVGFALELRTASGSALAFPFEGVVAPGMTAADLAPGRTLPDFDDLRRRREHGSAFPPDLVG